VVLLLCNEVFGRGRKEGRKEGGGISGYLVGKTRNRYFIACRGQKDCWREGGRLQSDLKAAPLLCLQCLLTSSVMNRSSQPPKCPLKGRHVATYGFGV